MEKIQETDEGYYVRNGDVLEWQWKGARQSPPEVITTDTVAPVAKRKRTAKPKSAPKKRSKK